MKNWTVSSIICAMLLLGMCAAAMVVNVTYAILPVHNIDTAEDFASIQEAIDDPDTEDGHTILVDSGTYYEHVAVNKKISLAGEDKFNTIIDGSHIGTVVTVPADNVSVVGFTIRNSGSVGWDCGLSLTSSSDSNISQNIMRNNKAGILLYYSSGNNVASNIAYLNTNEGITLYGSDDNVIAGNIASNNDQGISLGFFSVDNTIEGNTVSHGNYGISFWSDSNNNMIVGNDIWDNNHGIHFFDSYFNLFFHNNLVDNSLQIYGEGELNAWDAFYPFGGNFWSDFVDEDFFNGPPQNLPGRDGIWDHPNILDSNNKDNYPLAKPYVHGSLACSIYTDKYTYHAGETMHLGLNVANPDSVKYLCVAVWVKLPSSSVYLFMHEHSIVLPIGLNYVNSNFESLVLPSLPLGIYEWHAALLDPTTHAIIVEDTTEWEFTHERV